MSVKQISVFLENRQGRLMAVTKSLKAKGINIRALSLADTSDFGILRLIVDKPDLALTCLKECGFTVSTNNVIAVEVPDSPGGLNTVLEILEKAEVNLEYAYAFCNDDEDYALTIFRVDKENEASQALLQEGINVLAGEKVYSM